MANNQYVLVIDTNVLYKDYNKNLNFKDFSFSSTFDDIQLKIEELDIIDFVTIAVPEMCWEELKVQYIDEHISKLGQAKITLDRYKDLPEVFFEIKDDIDINEDSSEKVKKYKEAILYNKSGAKTINLTLPDDKSLKSIVQRAVNKKFPFHITGEHSDYGFKDVIIWESILKYKSENKEQKIILYGNDKGFNDTLCKEFEDKFNDEIKIVREKKDLYDLLEKIAAENIEGAKIYIPEPEGNEIETIKNWLKSSMFKNEILRVIDKTIFSNTAIIKQVSLLDYKFLNSEIDYGDYLMYMDVLLSFEIEGFKNDSETIIKKFTICVDLSYDETMPIVIPDSITGTQEETNEWIKELGNEINVN